MSQTYDNEDLILELKEELETAKDDLIAERKAHTAAVALVVRLIERAGDLIGTAPELRSLGCIDVAIDHAESLKKEVERLHGELKLNASMLAKQTDMAREAERFEIAESSRRLKLFLALERIALSLNWFDAVRIAEEAMEEDVRAKTTRVDREEGMTYKRGAGMTALNGSTDSTNRGERRKLWRRNWR